MTFKNTYKKHSFLYTIMEFDWKLNVSDRIVCLFERSLVKHGVVWWFVNVHNMQYNTMQCSTGRGNKWKRISKEININDVNAMHQWVVQSSATSDDAVNSEQREGKLQLVRWDSAAASAVDSVLYNEWLADLHWYWLQMSGAANSQGCSWDRENNQLHSNALVWVVAMQMAGLMECLNRTERNRIENAIQQPPSHMQIERDEIKHFYWIKL